MSLEIINNKGTFEVCGDFRNENIERVRAYFDDLLDKYYEVVICLNKVNCIDKSAIEVLKIIHNKAVKRSKILFILGEQNKTINVAFKVFNTSYLFKNDYN